MTTWDAPPVEKLELCVDLTNSSDQKLTVERGLAELRFGAQVLRPQKDNDQDKLVMAAATGGQFKLVFLMSDIPKGAAAGELHLENALTDENGAIAVPPLPLKTNRSKL